MRAKRILKLVLYGGPLVLLTWLVLSWILESRRTDAPLMPVERVVWGQGADAIRFSVSEQEKGETLRFRIQPTAASGQALEAHDFEVDRDMWGGGFVRAAQADEDPDLEIVAWGLHEADKTAFVLDFVDGQVTKVPFGAAPRELRDLALAWHQAHQLDPLGLVIYFVLAFGYYLALGVARAAYRALRRKAAVPPPAAA
jgi:hypothetical protein